MVETLDAPALFGTPRSGICSWETGGREAVAVDAPIEHPRRNHPGETSFSMANRRNPPLAFLMISWSPGGKDDEVARKVLTMAMWMHTTFSNEIWLWRGQSNVSHGVEPSAHTRVLDSGLPSNEDSVRAATVDLLEKAREARLDRQGETRLPDLALLAHLQHYGAATPLLDVTTDPLIALWMIAFASADEPTSGDETTGSLFGIRRPPEERHIRPLDARHYNGPTLPSICDSLEGKVWWYQAPDVTERLRIQRGSFLIGPLVSGATRKDGSLPFNYGTPGTEPKPDWVARRFKGYRKRGVPAAADSDVFRIKVPARAKLHLRALLKDRSGLSIATVYPTPWNRPFITQFAEAYGRRRPLELDLPAPVAVAS